MTDNEQNSTRTDTDARRRRPPLVTRPQAVQAAYELIAREGPEGLSMRKLATALHVSLPTVYTAIASKETLVGELQDRMISEISNGVTPALSAEGDAAERVCAMVDTVLIWCRRNPQLTNFLVQEAIQPTSALSSAGATTEQVRTAVVTELNAAVAADLSSVDPLVCVAYAMAQLRATISLAITDDGRVDDGMWAAIGAANIIAGLRQLCS